ncbi:MAG: hypothetical protein ACEQSU_12865 [Microgenomates group bacterium]
MRRQRHRTSVNLLPVRVRSVNLLIGLDILTGTCAAVRFEG